MSQIPEKRIDSGEHPIDILERNYQAIRKELDRFLEAETSARFTGKYTANWDVLALLVDSNRILRSIDCVPNRKKQQFINRVEFYNDQVKRIHQVSRRLFGLSEGSPESGT